MNTNENGAPDTQEEENGAENTENQEEVEDTNEEEEDDDDQGDEDTEDVEEGEEEEDPQDLDTALRQKKHWRKKAIDPKTGKTYKELYEGSQKGKGKKKSSTETEAPQLTQKDWLLLAKADVHEDDIDDVVEYATFKKITIKEALKSSTVKTILAEKADVRKTANATHKKGARKGAHKRTDDQILEDARQGNIPEPGTPEAEDLFWARRGGRPKDQ